MQNEGNKELVRLHHLPLRLVEKKVRQREGDLCEKIEKEMQQ